MFRGGNSLTTGLVPQGAPLPIFSLCFRSRNHHLFYVDAVGMAEDGDQLHAGLGTSDVYADRCQLALDPATSLRFVEFAWAYLRTHRGATPATHLSAPGKCRNAVRLQFSIRSIDRGRFSGML